MFILQPEVVVQKSKRWRLLCPVQVKPSYDKVPTLISWNSAYIVKGDTRAHRMCVNVLPTVYYKYNMAAETGSRNNLHSSSEDGLKADNKLLSDAMHNSMFTKFT